MKAPTPRPYTVTGITVRGRKIRTPSVKWNTTQEEARRRRQRDAIEAKKERR
jgi:hypothetical protein